MNTKSTHSAIVKASEFFGGQAGLARALSMSPANINQWMTGKRPVPIERCVAIEQATKGAITRQDLRPNDWAAIWPELTV